MNRFLVSIVAASFVALAIQRLEATPLRPARSLVVSHPVRIVVRVPRRVDRLRLRPPGRTYDGTVSTLSTAFASPTGVAYDSRAGYWFVADPGGNGVEIVTTKGVVQPYATFPVTGFGVIAELAYDKSVRHLYSTFSTGFGSSGYFQVLTVSSGKMTLLAGGTTQGSKDGQGSNAQFANPTGIALNTSDGALYVGDVDRIRRVTTSGAVTTFTKPGLLGGQRGASQQNALGLTYSAATGKLYVADPARNEIESVDSGGHVRVIAGRCMLQGSGPACVPFQEDGKAAQARFAAPLGVVADDADGSLLIVDSANFQIRRIDSAGNVTTLAGSGHVQRIDGVGLDASFSGPLSGAINPTNGNLLVGDSGALRRVTTTGPQPPPPPLPAVSTMVVPPAPSSAYGLASDSTGRLWFDLSSATQTYQVGGGFSHDFVFPYGYVAETSNNLYPSQPNVAVGADGNGYVGLVPVTYGNIAFARVHPSGKVDVVPYPGGPNQNFGDLATGPDGNVWFTLGSLLGEVDKHGRIFDYPVPTAGTFLATGGDGNVWITGGQDVMRFHPATGVTDSYAFSGSGPATKAPSGTDLWFTQPQAVGFIDTLGNVTLYPLLPYCNLGPCYGAGRITVGPDGALWFVDGGNGSIGRMTTDGVFTEYPIPTPRTTPQSIALGSDGNLYFTDPGSGRLGVVKFH